jgi:hypothetical protein
MGIIHYTKLQVTGIHEIDNMVWGHLLDFLDDYETDERIREDKIPMYMGIEPTTKKIMYFDLPPREIYYDIEDFYMFLMERAYHESQVSQVTDTMGVDLEILQDVIRQTITEMKRDGLL